MSKMNRMYADLKVSLRQLELEIEVTVCMYIYMCVSLIVGVWVGVIEYWFIMFFIVGFEEGEDDCSCRRDR